ncbi:DinB family protein [Aquisphaera insulae]|uniref:DinB family protein n=1 Tax=Aquisphaera insulae TaxID=2712864 RepID=UPI0013ECAA99|nr:DinB family protein [Aquisphaera insulae]
MPPTASRPGPNEYSAPPGAYIDLVSEDDVLAAMEAGLEGTTTTFRRLSEAESLVRHEPYTWSLKQVLGHIVDCERVFGFRAHAIARHDPAELPGFDENLYMSHSEFDPIPLAALVDEYENVRKSHLAFFRHLPAGAWTRIGVANGSPISVRALAFVIVGHERHHMRIVASRLGRS